MSVKTEYENLQQKVATLQREGRTAEKNFTAKKQEWQELLEKKKLLLERSSELAKRLLAVLEEQIRRVEGEKEEIDKTLQRLRDELESVQKRVRELEDNPQEYVEEQSRNMAQAIKEYVEKHEEEFGRVFKEEVEIWPKTNLMRFYNVPKGIIMIRFDHTTIVESSEYYFKQETYENIGDQIYFSKWFVKYFRLFCQTLRREITEAFKENQNFSVKFTDMAHFTIELR